MRAYPSCAAALLALGAPPLSASPSRSQLWSRTVLPGSAYPHGAAIASDGVGGVFVLENGGPNSKDLFMQHVDLAGAESPAWFTQDSSDPEYAAWAPDGAGGCFLLDGLGRFVDSSYVGH